MAKRSLGTKLKKGEVVIGSLTSISPPEKSADTVDITTLDSADGYKKFIQGMKDAGEVTVAGYYDSEDAGQTALDTAFESGAEETYTIEFPAAIGASFSFPGIVTNVKIGEANLDDPLGFEATLKVSGKPTLTVSPVVP